jgi:DNA-binding NtrC family response regulator
VPLADRATLPNQPHSLAGTPRFVLYFVFPRTLDGYFVGLSHGLELGRDATLPPPGDSQSSGAFAAVPHETVSRRHALVQFGLGVPILKDLGSSNGTFVNGVRLEETAPIDLQTVVRLGDTLAILDEPRAEDPEPGAVPPGRSPYMQRLQAQVARAAADRAPVLITGETGTGKELLAAEIHRASGRSGPYLRLNCAELAPQLIESQLFGHVRGAFTGATTAHEGLFVAADGGTLLLDEVAEIPLELQAKLLRVLQEGEVRPVGSVQTRPLDVRVVCATNHDLAARVEAGTFRRDLLARISFFELRLPALRDRKQDILWWLDRFAEKWSSERDAPRRLELHPSAAEKILLHAWPDNLRGLDRLVHRLLSTEDKGTVGLQALGEAMPELTRETLVEPGRPPDPLAPAAPPDTPTVDAAERTVEAPPTREEFLAAFEALDRNVRATSKHFGKDRKQIYRWLKTFGIER